jgi:hypothetical protein
MLISTVLIGERVMAAVFTGVEEGSFAFPVWLPQASTFSETVMFYTLFLKFVQYIAIPATLLWLAYAYGRDTADSAD